MTDKTKDRQEFEAWWQAYPMGEFYHIDADDVWAAWQAARAQPAPIIVSQHKLGDGVVLQAEPANTPTLYEPAPHDAQSVLPPLPKPADTALIQGPQGGEYRSLSDNYEPDCAMFSPNQMRAYGQLCRTSDRDAPFNPDWANYRQGLADGSDRDAVAMLRREIHNLRRQIEDYGRDAAQGEIVGGDSNHNTVILAIDGTVPRSLWTIGNRAAIRALKGEGK